MHDSTLFARLKAATAEDVNGCWIWQKSKRTDGYGQARIPGRRNPLGAHQVMWYAVHGELIRKVDGEICHECDVPLCINPAHLWKGTRRDNMRDMASKGRSFWANQTHCIHGHEFTPENTVPNYNGNEEPGRACRTCAGISQAAYRDRKRSERGGARREPVLDAERRAKALSLVEQRVPYKAISSELGIGVMQISRAVRRDKRERSGEQVRPISKSTGA